jgi:dienelactone hydrolase
MASAARRLAALVLSAAVTVGVLTVASTAYTANTATADESVSSSPSSNPYERGPDPTAESIRAEEGPFEVDEVDVARRSDFGGGTIYYPAGTDETDGTDEGTTFGGVAIAPGYLATQSSIAWYGPRLASQGFVVFTIDTITTSDQPASRGRQLLAALDYLTSGSEVTDRVDPERLAVMGHSMGGGGALEAAESQPALQAAIPLTGWHLDKDFSEVQVPTLVVGAENDAIAPVRSHSEPFYESLPATGDKAYLELAGASHYAPNVPDDTIAAHALSWLKRFVDDDTRYEQFLCPGPGPGDDDGAVSEYRSTCPF